MRVTLLGPVMSANCRRRVQREPTAASCGTLESSEAGGSIRNDFKINRIVISYYRRDRIHVNIVITGKGKVKEEKYRLEIAALKISRKLSTDSEEAAEKHDPTSTIAGYPFERILIEKY